MEGKIDICYIATNGFSVRMLTQTDLLGRLRETGKTVALICPDKSDPMLSAYCQKRDIVLEEFEEKNKFSTENYMFKRKYFLESIEDNVALMEKHVITTRYATSLHPLRRVRPYYYWLIYKLIEFFPAIRKRFINSERKYLRSSKAEELIRRLSPQKLIATYPVAFSEAVLLYYGNLNPKVETWIHLLSWDNISCKGKWPELASKFIVWGPIMHEELKAYYGIGDDQIFQCGVPHFDLHIQIKNNDNAKRFIAELGLDERRRYIFLGMSSPRFAPGEIDIVENLAKDIDAGHFGELQLVVRPHPQNVAGNLADGSWLPRLKKLATLRNVAVDFPRLIKSKISWSAASDDMIRLSNLIAGSSLVINSGSTISIDGLIHNKPVVLTSFDGKKNYPYWRSAVRLIDYPHLKKLKDEGGVHVVKSFKELAETIKIYLASSELNAASRVAALEREIFKNDGMATDRVIDVLLK